MRMQAKDVERLSKRNSAAWGKVKVCCAGAWEENGGARTCADCGKYLGPVAKPAAAVCQRVPSVPNRQINVMLPWPPSVNHYWLLNRNGSRRISEHGVRYRSDVWTATNRFLQIKGEIGITIAAHPPDKRRRDLDNILKALLDALQSAGVIEDDSNIVDLRIVRREVIKCGAVNVEIRAA